VTFKLQREITHNMKYDPNTMLVAFKLQREIIHKVKHFIYQTHKYKFNSIESLLKQ